MTDATTTMSQSPRSHRWVGFPEAIRLFFVNYLNFSGRSSRSAYWFSSLGNLLLSIFLSVLGSFAYAGGISFANPSVLSGIWTLLIIVPAIAISARRLHDVGRSGWWQLLHLTGIGSILILIWAIMPGTIGQNKFGEDTEAGRG